MMTEERDNYKEVVARVEGSFNEVVAKFEVEAKSKHDNFTTEYHDDSPQGKRVRNSHSLDMKSNTELPSDTDNIFNLFFLNNGIFSQFMNG